MEFANKKIVSGNRLYQTLGNLKANPRVGVVIPDFETSDVLYVSNAPSLTFLTLLSDAYTNCY